MGQIDTSFGADCYETRELAWELQQEYKDRDRIKFLMDSGADLRSAMRIAHVDADQLVKNPILKPLQLQKHLHAIN
jgi:hypothetical protein